jgi:hypothetical protein
MAGTFSSTISRRWYANESGQLIRKTLNVPEVISNHASRWLSLDARTLFTSNVTRGANWLGEVSNVVMRAETALLVRERKFAGISFAGLEDLGAFVCGAVANPVCFINEHLGYFRTSATQNSAEVMGMPLKLAHLAYISLGLIGRNSGLITADEAQKCIEAVAPAFMWHYRDELDVRDFREILSQMLNKNPSSENTYLHLWRDFVNDF